MDTTVLPPTIYIAIGAIAAAIITGSISLVNLVIAKDQETSAFRQKWIDKLRNDIAEFLKFSSLIANRNTILKGKKVKVTAEQLLEFVENTTSSLEEVHTRIQLRLNPKEHQVLLGLLKQMEQLFNKAGENIGKEMLALMDPIIHESQQVLKNEWKRVKRGELTYQIVKYGSLSLVIVFVVILALYVKGHGITQCFGQCFAQ